MPEVWEIARRFQSPACGVDIIEIYVFLREQNVVELSEFLEVLDSALEKGDFTVYERRTTSWLREAYAKQLEELPPGDNRCSKLREHILYKLTLADEGARRVERKEPEQHKVIPGILPAPSHSDMPWWYRNQLERHDYRFEKMMHAMKSYTEKPGAALEKARIHAERERARGEVAEMVQH